MTAALAFDPWEKHLRLLESDGYPTLEQVEDALSWAGRNRGPAIVWELHDAGLLHPRDAQRLVPQVWQMVEFPMVALDRDDWADLFAFCGGYLHNGVRRGRPRLARTLYRGAHPEHRDGWSWTDDRALAQWFADDRLRRPGGQLWTATVEPARLLARITNVRDGESEYVVNTDGLDITPAGAP